MNEQTETKTESKTLIRLGGFSKERFFHKRREKGFTYASLARIMGLSISTVESWGTRFEPSPKNLLKLAILLEVEPDWFYPL